MATTKSITTSQARSTPKNGTGTTTATTDRKACGSKSTNDVTPSALSSDGEWIYSLYLAAKGTPELRLLRDLSTCIRWALLTDSRRQNTHTLWRDLNETLQEMATSQEV